MTYVVLGGAGFIGSWLVEALLTRGDDVVALDNLTTGRLENLAGASRSDGFTFVHGDARDRRLLREVASSGDTLVHLAGTVGVDHVCKRPRTTYTNNVDSTEAVLSVAAGLRCRVLFASTSEVYGDLGYAPADEATPPRQASTHCGRGAYTMSKLVGERLCRLYERTHEVDVVVGRLFNAIGARQSDRYGMVVPRFVAQAVAGDPLTIFGDGRQTRCFCCVTDTARAIVQLCASREARGQVVNIDQTKE